VRDAAEESVTERTALAIFYIPIIGGCITALLFAHRPVYYWLLNEDHLAEWTQFGLLLAGAGVAAVAAGVHVRRREPAWAAALAVVALAFIVVAGEEISWAQRVFAFATPHDLAGVNHQQEFNVHNISAGGLPVEDIFKFAEMVVAGLAFVASVAVRLNRDYSHRSGWRRWSPPLFLAPGLLIAFLYRCFRFVVYSKDVPALVHYQEWIELCLYFSFFIMVLLYWRNLRASRPGQFPGLAQPGRPLGASDLAPGLHATRGIAAVLLGAAVVTVAFAIATMLQHVPVNHP
jgi:hypothetical protein